MPRDQRLQSDLRRAMRRPNDKLREIVVRRYGLNEDEAAELQGSTLDQLVTHARHLTARRTYVDGRLERDPYANRVAVEGAYDGGGVPLDELTGPGNARDMLGEMLSDRVRGHDSRTQGFLERVGRNTANAPDRSHDSDRTRELRARLRGASDYDEGDAA